MAPPASQLEGMQLEGGWAVGKRLEKLASQTGGHFSEGYLVTHTTGTRAFLKALDYSAALKTPDPARALQDLTAAYNFERDLLAKCQKMDRVVHAVADGSVMVPGPIAGDVVQYLIFELAEQDIRKFLDVSQQFDLAWLLRSSHHIATGLKQLHGADIAHQDLKPSNVLVFGKEVSKVADLGRAVAKSLTSPHDAYQIPGDTSYAPPELLYGYVHPDWNYRRLGCDVYHLGSMLVFLFARANMTALLFSQLDASHYPQTWSDTYNAVLPYVREAFGRAVDLFRADIASVPKAVQEELTDLVRQLCDPDPALRGDALGRSNGNQYSLERFITRLDLLATRTERGLFSS